MYSQVTLLRSSPPLHGITRSSPTEHRSNCFPGNNCLLGAKDACFILDFSARCLPTSDTQGLENKDILQRCQPIKAQSQLVSPFVEFVAEGEASKDFESDEIEKRVDYIRSKLGSVDDEDISVSPYDTAWVALIEDIQGGGSPQFPSSLQWIADNQLSDGSWGDEYIFSAYDRILNTFACVLALKSWNAHPKKLEKGVSFIKENICKLENEKPENMLAGFEVLLPSLMEKARKLGIDIPDNSPYLQEIYALRDLKLKRIPKNLMHTVPTTLLLSLEGMEDLDWEKLLKLQSSDGFLTSPSSTAFAFIQTRDEDCLRFLKEVTSKYNGGAPHSYPIDLFNRIWIVDRLERLGISRYFQTEIQDCLDYVYSRWTDRGIGWATNLQIGDLDDTNMGFRLLRLHGYEVSTDAFQPFTNGEEFFCFEGQTSEGVTVMYNLYKAAQVMFPGEKILEDAKQFSAKFLREKQASNELYDKWLLTKDLPGEVEYALDMPWYASLPRIETRFYLEHYGGEYDIWIAKVIYRLPHVNNNSYLELAKMDYNNCQKLHQTEWNSIQRWYTKNNFGEHGISRRDLLVAYFLAAANIFEPERSNERLAWCKSRILMEMVESYFQKEGTYCCEQRIAFLHEFENHTSGPDHVNGNKAGQTHMIKTLMETLNQLSMDTFVEHGIYIRPNLRQAWKKWLTAWDEEVCKSKGEGELLVHTVNLSGGRAVSEEILNHPQYKRLSDLTNRVCQQLCQFEINKVNASDNLDAYSGNVSTNQIESDMQELVQLVLQNSTNDIKADIKQTFLTVAKSFYYTAHCDSSTIDFHISKVLFEKVV